MLTLLRQEDCFNSRVLGQTEQYSRTLIPKADKQCDFEVCHCFIETD